MKPSEIKVGKTYCNRGKGMTMRRVIDIYHILGSDRIDDRISVRFMAMDATGNQLTTYSDSCPISSFAKWAGGEVEMEGGA